MVAIFTGAGTGLERGSGSVLGGAGLLGSAALGRSADQIFLNAATGNLVISQQDESLLGIGPDVGITRTYNSLGNLTDENGDNWRQSTDRRVFGFSGTVNAAGSSVKRRSADGSEITYSWNATASAYVATDGAGAYDTLNYSSSTGLWTWTDGDSRTTETYGWYGSEWWLLSQTDNSGNSLTFSYQAGTSHINRVTSSDGEYVQYNWTGNNINEIVTGFSALGNDLPIANAIYQIYDAAFNRRPDDSGFYTYLQSMREGFTIQQLADDAYNSTEFQNNSHAASLNDDQYVEYLYNTVLRRSSDTNGKYYYVGALGNHSMTRGQVLLSLAQSTEHLSYMSSHSLNFVGPLLQTRTRYGYDAYNRLQTVRVDLRPGDNSVSDGKVYTTTYGYRDTTSRLISSISQTDGSNLAISYDGSNRVHQLDQAIATGVTRSTIINYDSGSTTITDAANQVTTLTYDGNGALTQITAPPAASGVAPQVLHFAYTANGDVSSVTDAAGAVTNYGYDARGNAILTMDPDGNITVRTYSATNRLLTEAQELNRVENAAMQAGSMGWTYGFPSPIATQPATAGVWQGLSFVKGFFTATAANQNISLSTSGVDWIPVKAGERVAVQSGIEAQGAAGQLTLAVWFRDANGNTSQVQIGTLNGPQAFNTKISGFVDVPANAVDMRLELYCSSSGAGSGTFAIVRPMVTSAVPGQTQLPGFNSDLSEVNLIHYPAMDAGATGWTFGVDGSNIHNGGIVTGVNAGRPYAKGNFTATAANQLISVATGDSDWFSVTAGEKLGVLAGIEVQGPIATANLVLWVADANGITSSISLATWSGPQAFNTLASATIAIPANAVRARLELYGTTSGAGQGSLAIVQPSAKTMPHAGWLGPAVAATRYVYDSSDRLRFTVSAEGRVSEYRYDSHGQLAGIRAYDGQCYDVSGLGATTALSESQIVSWIGALADQTAVEQTILTYDDRGNLYRRVDYGMSSSPDWATTGRGYTEHWFTYDQAGQLLATSESGQAALQYLYDGLGRVTSAVDLNGGKTSYQFNDAATTTVVTLASGLVTTSTYNKAGELIATTQSGSYTTTGSASYQYDAVGRLRIVSDATSRKSYSLYDNVGRKIADVNAYGAVAEYRYDADDRVVATLRHAGLLTSTQLASLSDPNAVINLSTIPSDTANDIWNWTVYDKEGRAIESIAGDGSVVLYGYDASGRPISTQRFYYKLTAAQLTALRSAAPTSVVLPATDGRDSLSRTFYDKDGLAVGALDGEGYLTRTIYDAAGRVVQQIAYANATYPSYRAAGSFQDLIASATSGANDRSTRYVYDEQGFLRFEIDALNHVVEFDYDDASLLTIGAASARRTTRYAGTIGALGSYTFTSVQNALASMVGDSANRISFAVYDGSGHIAYSIDATGGVTGYRYDNLGNLVRQVGYATTYPTTTLPTLTAMTGWDVIHIADASNRIMRNYYDARNELRYAIDGEGYVSRFDYDAAGRQTAVYRYDTAASGVSDSWTIANAAAAATGTFSQISTYYDAAGRVSQSVDGLSHTLDYVYNANGTLYTQTRMAGDAAESKTQFAWDAAGHQTDVFGAKGTAQEARTQYSFDGEGNQWKTIDARTDATSRTYDRRGLLLSETDALGNTTSYQYDAFGAVTKVTDARQFSTYNYYDKLGHLIAQRDAENYVTETHYTAFDEVDYVTRRANRATNSAAVDVLPTVAPSTDDITTSFKYDKLGRLTDTIDAEKDSAGLNYYEHYTLNAFGQRTDVRNKLGGITYYDYYRTGLVKLETSPAQNKIYYEYDARGNLKKKVEAYGAPEARTTDYTYDNADRLVDKTWTATYLDASFVEATPTQVGEHYVYDARDNLIESDDANGAATRFYYDKLDRKIAELDAAGALTTYDYDTVGNLTAKRAYATVFTSVPTNIASGSRPTQTGDYRETTYVYDAINRLTDSTVSGVTVSGSTTTTGIRTGYWNGSSFVQALGGITTHYDYDAMGNVLKATYGKTSDSSTSAAVWSWYDKLGRKTEQVDQENYLTSWDLDANGNVKSETRYANRVAQSFDSTTAATALPSKLGSGAADADRVTSFTYDLDGRRTSEKRLGVVAFTIDTSGVKQNDTTGYSLVQYSYNGLGQVTQKIEATGDTINYEYNSDGTLKRELKPLINDGTTSLRPTIRYAYDGLGNMTSTIQGAADTNGNDLSGTRGTTYSFGTASQGTPGLLASMTDAAGNTTKYRYDKAGRLVRQDYNRVKSDGSISYESILFVRDALGQIRSQVTGIYTSDARTTVSGAGDVQDTDYNAFGQVVQSGTRAGWGSPTVYQQQFAYDATGALWRTNSGDGVWKYFVHDALGNQTLTLTSAGADLSALTFANYTSSITSVGGTGTVNAVTTITSFDRRGQATGTRAPDRQLTATTTQTLTTAATYNAFGEALSQTDARGNATSYTYNAMGRATEVKLASVDSFDETGTKATITPTTKNFYDRSGRLIGTQDANSVQYNTGKYSTRQLLAGTGYGGSNALVAKEWHADGGVVTNVYNRFGDQTSTTDERGRTANRSYDGMGRLIGEVHIGGLLTDSYSYDILGQRISHGQSWLAVSTYAAGSQIEKTDYDAQGRIVRQQGFAGDVTATSYVWSASLVAVNASSAAVAAAGGWVQTVTNANTRTEITSTDSFGHTVAKTDLGSHGTSYTYDFAGRMTGNTIGSDSNAYSWFNTGAIATLTRTSGGVATVQTSTYDANGNKVTETQTRAGTSLENATASYDALNRLSSWEETGNGTTFQHAKLDYKYDAVGNVRNAKGTGYLLDSGGNFTTNGTNDFWYTYDAMNRVLVEGSLATPGVGSIAAFRSTTYYLTGERKTFTTTSDHLTWAGRVTTNIGLPYYADNGEEDPDVYGWHSGTTTFSGKLIESYDYDAAGHLQTVAIAEEVGTAGGGSFGVVASGTMGTSVTRATFVSDGAGRMRHQTDLGLNTTGTAWITVFDRQLGYNSYGQLSTDTTSQLQGADTWGNTITNNYGTIGSTSYALGAVVSSTTVVTKNSSDSSAPDTSTTNNFAWYDGAVATSIVYNPDTSQSSTTYTTTNTLTAAGQIASSYITGPTTPTNRTRTVTFLLDALGQTIRRDEVDGDTNNGDPHQIWYRFNGRQMATIGNDGTDSSYDDSIAMRRTASGNGAFRNGATSGGSTFQFGETMSAFTSFAQGADGGSYTVQTNGETLSSIASAMWGDANLWYKLAQANGLGGDATLTLGQRLTIPSGVTRDRISATTFKPYDPAETLGNISPSGPAPRKQKCGVFGQILLAVVAIAVTIWASPASPNVWQAMLAAAVGNVASQAVGNITGIQDGFDFKSLGMSILSAGVAKGVDKLIPVGAASPWGRIAENALNGAVSSAISQGIGVATGLQQKFSWAGVAAAGVSAGVMQGVGDKIAGKVSPKLGRVIATTAGAVAGAATRSVIEGTDFGDNLIAVLPDVIGRALGGLKPKARARSASGSSASDGLTHEGAHASDAGQLPTAQLGQSTSIDTADGLRVTQTEFDWTQGQTSDGVWEAEHGRAWFLFDGAPGAGSGDVDGSKPLVMTDYEGGVPVPTPPGEEALITVKGHKGHGLGWRIADFLGFHKGGFFYNTWHNLNSDGTPNQNALARGGYRPSDISVTFQPGVRNGPGYDRMGQPLTGRSNYDSGRQFSNIVSDVNKVSLGTTFGRFGEWATYRVPDAAQRNAEIFDPYRGMTPDGRAFAHRMDQLEEGTISGIATGIAMQSGASDRTIDMIYQLGSAGDGFLIAGGSMAGARVPGIGNQLELSIVNGQNGVHGNSRLSGRTTYLYELQTKTGEFLKYGISVNPSTRYSISFMKDKDIFRITSGTRADMMALERQMVISDPTGPLNRESWAVKARGRQ